MSTAPTPLKQTLADLIQLATEMQAQDATPADIEALEELVKQAKAKLAAQ